MPCEMSMVWNWAVVVLLQSVGMYTVELADNFTVVCLADKA